MVLLRSCWNGVDAPSRRPHGAYGGRCPWCLPFRAEPSLPSDAFTVTRLLPWRPSPGPCACVAVPRGPARVGLCASVLSESAAACSEGCCWLPGLWLLSFQGSWHLPLAQPTSLPSSTQDAHTGLLQWPPAVPPPISSVSSARPSRHSCVHFRSELSFSL